MSSKPISIQKTWLSFLPLLCLVVLFTLMAYTAPASPLAETQRLATYSTTLKNRQNQLKEEVQSHGKSCANRDLFEKTHAAFLSRFCSPFSPTQALPEWKNFTSLIQKEKIPKTEILACTETWVEHCEFSYSSAYRAAFLLDYAYWNLEIDKLGRETTDGLKVRDRLYELAALSDSITFLDERLASLPTAPDRKDAILSKPLPLAKMIEGASEALGLTSIQGITESLDLRSAPQSNRNIPLSVIFTEDITSVLKNTDDLRVMREIYSYLKTLIRPEARALLAEPHGGWKKLMEISNQNPRQILRVLGTLASLRDWVRMAYPESLALHGLLSPENFDALIAGSASYYLLNTIDELTADLEPNQKDLRYHFFYPPEYSTTDWKIYHWFSNAHLGCRVRERGFSESDAKLGTRLLATTYEAITLNLAGPSKKAMNVDPRISPILEGYRDIELNAEAGAWGASLNACQSHP